MKKTLLLFTLTASAIFGSAQVSTDQHTGLNVPVAPSQVLNAVTTETLSLKESEFNFGKIPQGKPVTHLFEVGNTGKTPFKLDNVQASCGCTTPEWNKEKSIGPGETSVITVGYNAAAEGPFTKTITVTYNGTQNKVIIIKGEVWKTPATSVPVNMGLNDLKN